MGPVQLRLLMQPAHWSQEARHAKILKQTLDHFERWYGPYPYKTLTLVDPEPDSAAGGMEYPTFITGDTTWWMPSGIYLPELVVEHEFGHQYWYGMVATNEFEDAWLDEGINSYTEVKIMDSVLSRDTSFLNQFGITAGNREIQRIQYIGVADFDPLARKAYGYASFNSYGGVTYGKTASVLLTLEQLIGEDTVQKALKTYFIRYRFTHPTKEDFLKTVEEVSGKDLRWYFNQAVYGTQVLDYEVIRISSDPVNWYEKNSKKKRAKPSTIESDNSSQRRFCLSGRGRGYSITARKSANIGTVRYRWVRLTYRKKAKIESVEVIRITGSILIATTSITVERANRGQQLPASSPTTGISSSQIFARCLTWWLV